MNIVLYGEDNSCYTFDPEPLLNPGFVQVDWTTDGQTLE